jgi:hypothetical protein
MLPPILQPAQTSAQGRFVLDPNREQVRDPLQNVFDPLEDCRAWWKRFWLEQWVGH